MSLPVGWATTTVSPTVGGWIFSVFRPFSLIFPHLGGCRSLVMTIGEEFGFFGYAQNDRGFAQGDGCYAQGNGDSRERRVAP